MGGVTGIGGALRPVEAASAGIITGAQINSRPITRPGEVLEEVPGLIVTQHSGEGKANQFFLRGFNLDHGTDIALHVDGMPVNMRTHAHGQGYADLNFLIPELVGAVEFTRGRTSCATAISPRPARCASTTSISSTATWR